MFSITDELKFVIEPQIAPCRGPLFLARSLELAGGDNVIANGGFGLVDTGKRKLLVTCQHVWQIFQEEQSRDPEVRMCVCLDKQRPVVFDQNHPIDQDSALDLATFDISPVLAACRGRQFYNLAQNPAPRVKVRDKLVLLGNQGQFRFGSEQGLTFGTTTYACEVSDVSGLRVIADLSKARNKFVVEAVGRPKPNTSPHGGISGSPCFLVQGDRPVRLIGFVTDDWLNSLWFTHARCLNPDGTLDRTAQ